MSVRGAPAVRLALLGCGKRKASHACAARDIYTGPLFRASLAHAERTAAEVLIVSALHGLVDLHDELQPYELHLGDVSVVRRRAWADALLDELALRFAGQLVEATVYAGATYARPLVERASLDERLRGWTWLEPLRGLQVGERLAWYRRRRGVSTEAELGGAW